MKLRVTNGVIYDESGDVVGAITDHDFTGIVEKTIECGSEAVEAIKDFVGKINSGSFKLRSAVKEFEKLLDKYDIQ